MKKILKFNKKILSSFKDRAIILKVEKISEKDLLYTLFSENFWKIRANKKFSKKEKNLDLGYIINFEIVTKENVSIHKIKNIKIKSEFFLENKSFSEINIFLEILSIIFKEMMDWLQNKEIFSIIEEINKKEKIDETKLILAKIKLKFILWILGTENKNQIISKILKFVYNNKIKEIFKLKWINEDLKNILKNL